MFANDKRFEERYSYIVQNAVCIGITEKYQSVGFMGTPNRPYFHLDNLDKS